MPYAPPRHCHVTGHPAFTGKGCPLCAKARDQARGSAASRGYDASWQKLRRDFLKQHPVCCRCGGEATEADHITSVRDRPDLRLSWANLRPMCKPCHSQRTSLEQVSRTRGG